MTKKHIKDKKLSKVTGGQQPPFDDNIANGDGGAIDCKNRNVNVIK